MTASRWKFWGWGYEGSRLAPAEECRLLEFYAGRFGLEGGVRVSAPTVDEVALRAPRLDPPARLAHLCSTEPHDRLVHTYGKSYPEAVRGFARDFSNAPDVVGIPRSEGDLVALLDWASRCSCRGDPVRWRLECGRWGRAGGGRGFRRHHQPRSEGPRPGARDRPHEPGSPHPGRRLGTGARDSAQAERPHASPLPPELRVLDARRLDRDALRRSLRHALHPYRRLRRKPACGDARGHHGEPPAARLRRGAEPRSPDDRLRRRARDNHRGLDAPAASTDLPRRRGGRLRRFPGRGARRARRGAGRPVPLESAPGRCCRMRRERRERRQLRAAGAGLRVGRSPGRRLAGPRAASWCGTTAAGCCRTLAPRRPGVPRSSACRTSARCSCRGT